MAYLTLSLKGERWLAYPYGLRFPSVFRKCYPMRGRGIVACLLYWLNRVGLDRLILRKEKVRDGLDFPVLNDVAFYWPAVNRSSVRFYGYRVLGGRIKSYLKFAKTRDEAEVLRKEFENTKKAQQIEGREFLIPKPLGFSNDVGGGLAVAEYEALPQNFSNIPLNERWISKVSKAREHLVKEKLSHGDFMWHNFKSDGENLWILDWEELSEISDARPELTDEISFWTAMVYYNKGASLDFVCNEFKQRYFVNSNLKEQAFAALNSMSSRGIAMGKILLKELEGSRK